VNRRPLNDWRRYVIGRSQLLFNSQEAEIQAAERAPRSEASFDPLKLGRRLRVVLAYSHFDYGAQARGISYETTAFRDPLHWLGCDITDVRIDVLSRRGPRFASKALLETVFRFEPDVFLLIPFKEEVQPETLGQIRDELGVPTVAWFSDDHWRFENYSKRFLPYLSVAVTTARNAVEKYRSLGFERVVKSQWSANHRIFRPLREPAVYDLSFVGQPHSNRREMVDRLRSAGLRVVTRGFGWPEGRASLREMVVISNQSAVCLNFSGASLGRENQIKGRDFEIPAMGRPMLTAATAELDEYFTNQEVAVYRDADEMVDLARQLVADQQRREAVAAAGYARCVREHTAERRLADMFRTMADAGWLAAR
jgi:spore maturation protein CgeB